MLPPNVKKEFRLQLARYLLVAEKYDWRWHYDQVRPGRGYGDAPSAEHVSDCSMFLSLSFYAAQRWAHTAVADPLGQHYSGTGNTSSAFDFLHHHAAPDDKYRVGDIALYLDGEWWHHHTTVCFEEGSARTAKFMSMGSESGPDRRNLYYRSDLTGVYRHPALL